MKVPKDPRATLKAEEYIQNYLNWRPPNGVDIGIKVGARKRFRERIVGWRITRKSKGIVDDERMYYTYYQAQNHVQDFLDRIRTHPKWLKRIDSMVQFETPAEFDPDDPSNWKYGLSFMTNEPFDEEFEGWEIIQGPIETKVRGTFITRYRCKEADWQDLIDTVREDEELDPIVDHMIPDQFDHNPERMITNARVMGEIEKKQRRNITAIKGGGFKRTKYEYPTDCVTKKDRSTYRRMMRKRNG